MYSIKRSKATTAKFKNFAINDSKNLTENIDIWICEKEE